MFGNQRNFSEWTDLCRTVAAVSVTVSHARDVLIIDYPNQRLWLPLYALTGFGHSAVVVFFVLSGFWISRSVWRRVDAQADEPLQKSFWPAYLIDRLSRLGIVLVPALVLGGLLDAIGAYWLHLPLYQGRSGAHSVTQNVAATLTIPIFLGNLAFLQTIAVSPWGSNGPLWSLAFEFWYYLWFPALALLICRRRLSPVLLTLLIGAANPELYWGFVSWLIGGALLLQVEGAPDEPPVGRVWILLAAGLFVGALLAVAMIRQVWTDPILAICFGLVLLGLVKTALPFPQQLSLVAQYGRKASFSLYVVHFPILALVGGWATGSARWAPSLSALMLVLALTALCICAGWLFAQGSEAFTPCLRVWLHERLLARGKQRGV